MSDVVVLSLRTVPDGPVEVDDVSPDRYATLSASQIAALPVWRRRRTLQIGDLFDVRGGRGARVRVEGDLRLVHGLGAGMSAGELVIDGDAGNEVGRRMRGGVLTVIGSTGHRAGLDMSGGVLQVLGSAGDDVGGALPGASRGMTGGEILVHGSAGAGVGARARRGLVVVGGDTSDDAGRSMIAGTVVVFGNAARGAAAGSKRGTLVACGDVPIPLTFRYACTYRPPHLALLLTHLSRRHAFPVDERFTHGSYRRYCGDAAELDRGEILQWTAA